MINNLITEEEIKKVWENSTLLPFEKIFADLNLGKMPSAEPIILRNGYGVGMTIDYYSKGDKKRKIRHIYVSNPDGEIDPAIADMLASKVLGKNYNFIGPMSTKKIFHYMKEFENDIK